MATLQIVVPMAGLGSRFADRGYEKIKPFIDVAGRPMIARVCENLRVDGAKFVFIAREEHRQEIECELEPCLDGTAFEVVYIERVTEGAACTVLCARKALDLAAPMMIANSDQIVDLDMDTFVADAEERRLDGSILTFPCPDRSTKWSYVRVDVNGLVDLVREKEPISDRATVGIYWFARASTFFDGALDMVARNERVNGEFYVCPVYQEAIRGEQRIGIFDIPVAAMHGIGTPEDLEAYLSLLTTKG
ncbi:MAG: glycosyltransferase family 2 protein [Planctomycetes bacterium]|nr:glycosyltransferase family 2 protein [Planctomycetota bacterium]